MTIIAGVFDTESKVDDVLRALYERDIDSDRVTLMRGAGQQGDSQIQRSDATTPNIPVGAAANPNLGGSQHGTPAVATMATGSINNLGIKPEEMDYYTTLADRGAVVIFVESEDADELEFARHTMNEGAPQRLDVL